MRHHFTEAEALRTKLAFQRMITALAPVQVDDLTRQVLGESIEELARSLGYGIMNGRVL